MCPGKVFLTLFSYIEQNEYFLTTPKDIIDVTRENNWGIHSQTPVISKFSLIPKGTKIH